MGKEGQPEHVPMRTCRHFSRRVSNGWGTSAATEFDESL